MKFEQDKTGGLVHAHAGCDAERCNWYCGDCQKAVKESYRHTEKTGHITWLETGYSYRRVATGDKT